MTEQPDYLTVEEAAALLRITPHSVRALLRRGELPGRKVGKEWRLSRKNLEGWMNQTEPPPEKTDTK